MTSAAGSGTSNVAWRRVADQPIHASDSLEGFAVAEFDDEPTFEAAMEYARRRWHVFPCNREKKPLTRWGLGSEGHRATTEEFWVRWWFTYRFRRALIGIACGPSGLLVVDAIRRTEAT